MHHFRPNNRKTVFQTVSQTNNRPSVSRSVNAASAAWCRGGTSGRSGGIRTHDRRFWSSLQGWRRRIITHDHDSPLPHAHQAEAYGGDRDKQ